MGTIKFTYQLNDPKIIPDQIIAEIEYGVSFSLYSDHESVLFPQFPKAHWIKNLYSNKDSLFIEVDDDFFDEYVVFEKIWTTFILNLLDFGQLKLLDIDFSGSFLSGRFSDPIPEFQYTPVLGTIIKPYYQPLNQKIELVSILNNYGLQVFKEDETYLVGKNQVVEHAIPIQNVLQNKGFYIPNVTPFLSDHEFIEKLIKEADIRIVLVNFLVSGLSPIFRLKQEFPDLGIWGHRVGYSAFRDVISIRAISKMAVSAGIDFLHIGTPNNPDSSFEKLQLINELKSIKPFKGVFTKTNPSTIPDLVRTFKDEAIYLACGSLKNDDAISFDLEKVKEWVMKAHQ